MSGGSWAHFWHAPEATEVASLNDAGAAALPLEISKQRHAAHASFANACMQSSMHAELDRGTDTNRRLDEKAGAVALEEGLQQHQARAKPRQRSRQQRIPGVQDFIHAARVLKEQPRLASDTRT